VFENIKLFSVIKSSDIEGVVQGCLDMIEKDFYPLGPPFKRGKKYMQIIVEYKKIESCQIN
tara:strand:+ start:276 stop:458 length:183 start_codon:yes stop_codon:yes gene_type:complete